jgi:hypothetical protein
MGRNARFFSMFTEQTDQDAWENRTVRNAPSDTPADRWSRHILLLRAYSAQRELQMNELSVVDNALDSGPRGRFSAMSMIAEEAGRAIRESGFVTTIQGREFVTVEGWTMIGLAWGCTAREREVRYVDGLGWEATVDVVRIESGTVIGGASHICGDDEATWCKRDQYARRSMAVTRATGKAFRMLFSATVKMAGYEPTPAEEMPVEAKSPTKPDKPSPKPAKAPEAVNKAAEAVNKARQAIAFATERGQCDAIRDRIDKHPDLSTGDKLALLADLDQHEALIDSK